MVGHFAGIAASLIIGGWAATFIASQVRLTLFFEVPNQTKLPMSQAVSYLVGEILVLLIFS